jgi:hypothetical protein
MSATLNLRELERKAWRSVFQDGLWDIYLGLLLLAMAVGAWLSDMGLTTARHYGAYGALVGLSMLVLWAGKHFVTLPRMGRVEFGPKRKATLNWVRALLFVSVLAGVAAFLVAVAMQGDPGQRVNVALLFPAAWVVNVLVVFGLGAHFLDFSRLHVIGLMYAIPVPVDMLLGKLLGIDLTFVAFGLPAAVILVMGGVVFARFLRDYPLPTVGSGLSS